VREAIALGEDLTVSDQDSADVDRVWELMKSISFCMFSNWNGERLRSRPMGAFVRRDEGAIWFFTDDRAHKDDEIRDFPKVCLAFADTHRQKYVSVSGHAEGSVDRDKIKELWSIPAKLWWNSPDDAHLRLIKVTPEQAEYWDAPDNVITGLEVAFHLLKGSTPKGIGEHRKVTL
jgi:general stress protein 26